LTAAASEPTEAATTTAPPDTPSVAPLTTQAPEATTTARRTTKAGPTTTTRPSTTSPTAGVFGPIDSPSMACCGPPPPNNCRAEDLSYSITVDYSGQTSTGFALWETNNSSTPCAADLGCWRPYVQVFAADGTKVVDSSRPGWTCTSSGDRHP